MVLVSNLLLDRIHNTEWWVTAIVIARRTLFCTQKMQWQLESIWGISNVVSWLLTWFARTLCLLNVHLAWRTKLDGIKSMHFSLVWSGKCTMGIDWFFSEDLGFCCFFEDQYHIGRGHISAGMGRDLYKLLQQRANQWYSLAFPDFFPLARDKEDLHCYLHQKKLQSFLSSQFHLTDLECWWVQSTVCFALAERKWLCVNPCSRYGFSVSIWAIFL